MVAVFENKRLPLCFQFSIIQTQGFIFHGLFMVTSLFMVFIYNDNFGF